MVDMRVEKGNCHLHCSCLADALPSAVVLAVACLVEVEAAETLPGDTVQDTKAGSAVIALTRARNIRGRQGIGGCCVLSAFNADARAHGMEHEFVGVRIEVRL